MDKKQLELTPEHVEPQIDGAKANRMSVLTMGEATAGGKPEAQQSWKKEKKELPGVRAVKRACAPALVHAQRPSVWPEDRDRERERETWNVKRNTRAHAVNSRRAQA